MAKIFADFFFTGLGSSGEALPNATLTFYATGTSTLQTVYSDNALAVPLSNPVVADSAGRFPAIFLQDLTYRAVLATSGGTILATVDNISGTPNDGVARLAVANVFTKTQTWAKGADVASATALALGTDGNSFDVTGTTTITSIGTLGVGTWAIIHFDGILTLTHDATDLVLPNGEDITTAAGDIAIFYEYATGDWRLASYQRAAVPVDGLPDISVQPGALSVGTDTAHEIDIAAGTWRAQDAAQAITLGATTIDIENSGNGGILDSETLDIDTWYAVLSGKNTSDGAFVAGFKKTEAKPAAWDNFRRHGWVRTDSSSNIIAFRQLKDDFYWDAQQVLLSSGSSTTEASVSYANFVPTTAERFLLNIGVTHTGSGSQEDVLFKLVTGQTHYIQRTFGVDGNANNGGGSGAQVIWPNEAVQSLLYAWGGTPTGRDLDLWCAGYTDRRGRDG